MQLSATSELERAIGTDVATLVGDFETLVRLYRPKVFRFALASLRDVDAALLRAYQAREGFRQDCSMHTWLMQIAVDLIRDHTRNRRLQFWRRASLIAKPIDVAGACDCRSRAIPGSAGAIARTSGGDLDRG